MGPARPCAHSADRWPPPAFAETTHPILLPRCYSLQTIFGKLDNGVSPPISKAIPIASMRPTSRQKNLFGIRRHLLGYFRRWLRAARSKEFRRNLFARTSHKQCRVIRFEKVIRQVGGDGVLWAGFRAFNEDCYRLWTNSVSRDHRIRYLQRIKCING